MPISLKIAGTKYYPIEPPIMGTKLTLQADPENAHDANAIKVLDPDGEQLGHVPAAAAAIIQLFANETGLRAEDLFEAKMGYGEEFILSIKKPGDSEGAADKA